MCDALYSNNVLNSRDIPSLLQRVVCSLDSIDCAERKCKECQNRTVIEPSKVTANVLSYFQWERVVDDETCYARTKCIQKFDSAVGLSQQFEKMLHTYVPHFFRCIHQFREMRKMKENVKSDEVILHVDFSENYECKWSSEVQSAHFGTRNQIVLHQGVMYRKDENPQSFVTLSDDSRKTAAAVAAHINSILLEITQHMKIQKLIVFSDSPSSQYRNRAMIFLLSEVCKSHGITAYEWLYSEAGHGKGAPDGVGAALKRTVDAFIAEQKHSVQSTADFMTAVTESKIVTKIVKKREIDTMSDLINRRRLRPMNGIGKAHHILWKNNLFYFRPLACSCNVDCTCFNLQQWLHI